MIQKLLIENIALIEQMSIDFNHGLNVITGETGAGKSIILNSISFVLGNKIDADMIRYGTKKASVQVIFSQIKSNKEKINKILEKLNIEKTEDIIIKREIFRNYKTINCINNVLVKSEDIHSISKLIVDISNQHSNQSITQIKNHLEILDSFSKILKEKDLVYKYYKAYQSSKLRLNKLLQIDFNQKKQIELYKFAEQEIEDYKLKENEEDKLKSEIKNLSNFQELSEQSNLIYQNIYKNEKSAMSLIEKSLTNIETITNLNPSLKNTHQELEQAFYLLENVKDSIRAYKENLEYSPQKLETLEDRLNKINKLKRKYGNTIKEILNYKSKCNQEINNFQENKSQITKLKEKISQIQKILKQKALDLSKKRKENALNLSKLVEKELTDLAMSKTIFKINFTYNYSPENYIKNKNEKIKIDENGIDKIEFMFSANPGEKVKSLNKIASGGELSRFTLAIKNILSNTDKIDSLIFDEVDTGIGGETLIKVSQKLKNISEKRQVICITHAAQIASQANQHYLIKKYQSNNRIKTKIKELSKNESKKEIARMISGDKLTNTSLKHAEEIINKAKETQK